MFGLIFDTNGFVIVLSVCVVLSCLVPALRVVCCVLLGRFRIFGGWSYGGVGRGEMPGVEIWYRNWMALRALLGKSRAHWVCYARTTRTFSLPMCCDGRSCSRRRLRGRPARTCACPCCACRLLLKNGPQWLNPRKYVRTYPSARGSKRLSRYQFRVSMRDIFSNPRGAGYDIHILHTYYYYIYLKYDIYIYMYVWVSLPG